MSNFCVSAGFAGEGLGLALFASHLSGRFALHESVWRRCPPEFVVRCYCAACVNFIERRSLCQENL
jgi:hypothetical protein